MSNQFFLISIFLLSFNANCQTFDWGINHNSSSYSKATGKSMATDMDGNIYRIGSFDGPSDFDPGVGTHIISSVGGSEDIYIQKLSATGDLIWVRSLGSTGFDVGLSISLDQNANIFCTGSFRETVDFDPGAGVSSLTSNGADDIFLLKLDSAGIYEWAYNIGGIISDEGSDVAIDSTGNVYLTGYFRATVDFDPGIGITSIASISGSEDVFYTKYTNDGVFVWAFAIGGSGHDNGTRIVINQANQVLISGFFHSTIDMDAGIGTSTLTSIAGSGSFVLKTDSLGAFIWASGMGLGIYQVNARALTVDSVGNIFVTGNFDGTSDFGIYSLTAIEGRDVFICKLDDAGVVLWAKAIHASDGLASIDIGYDIEVDALGAIYIVGNFRGTADLDPGAGVFSVTATSGSDIFFVKLDFTGDFVSGFYLPAAECKSIFLNDDNTFYMTGFFSGTLDFDPGPGLFTLMSSGSGSDYLIKLSQPVPLPLMYLKWNLMPCADFACVEWNTQQEENILYFQVEKSSDAFSFYSIFSQTPTNNSAGAFYSFQDKLLIPGDNYYRIKTTFLDKEIQYSDTKKINHLNDSEPPRLIPLSHQDNLYQIIAPYTVSLALIYNSSGQLVRYLSHPQIIDLTALAGGIYYIQFKSQKQHSVMKIIRD